MSMWDRDDEEFKEDYIPVEEDMGEEPTVMQVDDIDDSVLENIINESAFDMSNEQAATVHNARIRLEQANLYEMLINHDLFDGVSVSKQAIDNVQNELKQFILARLEILLGIRKPVQKETKIVHRTDFNAVEVKFLKALAYKGTNGASATSNSSHSDEQSDDESEGDSEVKEVKINKINSLQSKPTVVKSLAKPLVSKPAIKTSTVSTSAKQPAKQVQKQPVKQQPIVNKQPATKRNIAQDLSIEEIARKDLNETSKRKPFEKMTPKERQDMALEVAEKYKAPKKPKDAMPMLSYDQSYAKYSQQVNSFSNSNDTMQQITSKVAEAIVRSKNNQ